MSEVPHAAEPVSAHTAVEQAASAWIERRDRTEWDAGLQSQLDAWLNELLAHRIAFWRLEAAWGRTERLAALRPVDLQRPRTEIARAPRNALKFAAALSVLAVVGGVAALYLSTPAYQTFATTFGGREVLTLRDGSVIELNASTVIHLSDNGKERRVSLEKGEAYFNIQHDGAHPFVVTVGNHRITDLGTKFSVRSEPGNLRVALMEGRAEIDSLDAKDTSHPVVLMPGEVAVATAESVSISKQPIRALSDALGWRRGQLIFYHTSLADAAAEFNRYNHHQLVITDPRTAQLVVNGSFPINGIDGFTQAAQQVFGVRVKHRGDRIVISR